MAKIFGERWHVVSARPLAKGPQAEVFRVIDTRGAFEGEYALKHILHPLQHDRFRREIEAVTALRHPNVIGLVDDSAFRNPAGDPEKHFLVMPIADGGELGSKGRIDRYKQCIDVVLQVGRQAASALIAAHDEGILHRDLKPSNILFMGLGHEVWLSDFGISLIREAALPDPANAAARAFMAPELENGAQLDVAPAADVFSLGKVLYFMYSGGMIPPGERLADPASNGLFQKGKRPGLLENLLRTMVCPLEDRVKTMPEVLMQLEAIGNRD
ncbi:MAG TPA: protein kinase [Acidobacteriaceae bacterium]|jgi:serine/threonine protein kinase|nr:protein kinase [Acidobacteriaceae bacterium]